MPLFRRKPKPPPEPSVSLPIGERVERATEATLLRGKDALKGNLFLTNQRLLFEARKGDARWMVVPWSEVKSAGLYRWQGAMGPSSRSQCLVVETTKGEQVWWDFREDEERAWLPLVQQRAAAAVSQQPAELDDSDSAETWARRGRW